MIPFTVSLSNALLTPSQGMNGIHLFRASLTRFGTEKQKLRRLALGIALIIGELMLLNNPAKEDHFKKARELDRIPSSFTIEHDLELYDYHDYYLFSALSVGREGHKTLLTFGFLSLVI